MTETATPAAAETAAPETEDNDAASLLPKKSWMTRQMDKAVRGGLRVMFKTLFGAKIRGTENFNGLEGKPTLVIANHVSFIDGLLLGATMPVEASFAIDTGMYNKIMKHPMVRFNPVAKFLLNRIDFHPLDTTKP